MTRLALFGIAAALAVPGIAQTPHTDHSAPRPQTRAEAEARVRAHFALMDADHDGFVTRDEISASVDKMVADQRALAFDAMDTNHDGSISRAEFAAGRAPANEHVVTRIERRDAPPGAAPGETHIRIVREGGADGGMMMMGMSGKDGRIAIADVVKASLARFDKADANHDGILTPEERKAARDAMHMEMHPPAG